METGTIHELTEHNSGYITRAGTNVTLFFRADELVGTTYSALKKGTKVTFKMIQSLKGPYATQVSKI